MLIAIHHLLIDGVSWRILLEDFASGYEQAERGQTIQLPQKTDSFPFWADQLSKYAAETDMEEEIAYWTELSSIKPQPLPKDTISEGSLLSDSEEVTIQWTKEETEQLLKQANRAYNTDINDLAADFVRAGRSQVDRHGRHCREFGRPRERTDYSGC